MGMVLQVRRAHAALPWAAAVLLAVALVCMALAGAVGSSLAERNKAVVVAFTNLAYNDHDPAQAFARYAAPDFHHHAQWASGVDHRDIVQHDIAAATRLAQQFPQSHRDIKLVVAQGDYVVVHSHASGGPGVGERITNMKKGGEVAPRSGEQIIDIYRLARGLIAEHWEVSQPTTSLEDVY
ncbi:MAG: nuclear transport factor 2 family protein [Steroidobacteraceae bacterium]